MSSSSSNPRTVIGWHRAGFRFYWRRRSRSRCGRLRIAPELRDLITRLAKENPDCAQDSRRTAEARFHHRRADRRRYLRRVVRRGDPGQKWLAFLHNHREVLAACDFFTVSTVTFRVLYCFIVIAHERRKILALDYNVTQHPTADWIVQQLREAFSRALPVSLRDPGSGPKVLWGGAGSCRREILDHLIALKEDHLRRILRNYHQEDRLHAGQGHAEPAPDGTTARRECSGDVYDALGGLHHRYTWRQSA